jgi:hypothetical protein
VGFSSDKATRWLNKSDCSKKVNSYNFKTTILGASITSGEGADRKNLEWDITTLKNVWFVKKLKNPGVKVAHLVAPGSSLIRFDSVFDAILYSVMPGEEISNALINILYGKTNPSGKLTFTLPNR